MNPSQSCPPSARLCYEPIRLHHAAELRHALCDPRVYEFIDGPCPTLDHLERAFRAKEAGPPAHRPGERWFDCAVRLRDTSEAIGRLEATIVGHRAEVAYLFGPTYWGRGYAAEGLDWLHRCLIDSYGVTEVWATVAPGNARSVRLLERAGYHEARPETWPPLTSYDPGDRVFSSPAAGDPP